MTDFENHLDPKISVEGYIRKCPDKFEDRRGHSHSFAIIKSPEVHAHNKSIEVESGSGKHGAKNIASFKVEADGTIEVFANPDLHNNSSVVVLIEKSKPSIARSQSRTLAELLRYLSERFGHGQHADGHVGVGLRDMRHCENSSHRSVYESRGTSCDSRNYAFARRRSKRDLSQLSYTNESNESAGLDSFAARLALSAQKQSIGSYAHYECSHYVRKAFDEVDPLLDRLFAGCAKDDHFGDDSRFKIVCDDKMTLDLQNLQPGDTIVYGPTIGTADAGHVETMGLDHLMHSDFTHKLTMRFVDKYQWLTVYRPTSNA